MRHISIDIETYSSVDLKSAGMYKYVQSPDFEILLLAYQTDDMKEPAIIDFTTDKGADSHEQPVWDSLFDILISPDWIKHAHNAAFERTCLSFWLRELMPPEQWRCTMALSAYCGLPLSLDAVGSALNLDTKKDAAGKKLISMFCAPVKATKANGGRTRNLPTDLPEQWEAFKAYCKQDVRTERAIIDKLWLKELPAAEQRVWELDQHINDYGVKIDRTLVQNAIAINEVNSEDLLQQARLLTGLENPKSTSQLIGWLRYQGVHTDSVSKENVQNLMAETENPKVLQVLNLRSELSKTSIKKYEAMAAAISYGDDRVRGLLQYYGANRTGRWAGRLVQVQNLPRNSMKSLDIARSLVKDNDYQCLSVLYDSIPDTLSQLVRTAFVAPMGHRFIVSDFSQIEARVLAWLANEKWRMDVFREGKDIYKSSASQMFKIPFDQIDKALRQRGKVSELALGYQGGPGALIAMGALKMGLTEEELPIIVRKWREASPNIVKLWNLVEDYAISAVEGEPGKARGITYMRKNGHLNVILPSGRTLHYINAQLRRNKFGSSQIRYQGMDQERKIWTYVDTYGGKLVENIVQAVSRDLLASAMLRLHEAGYKIVMHIHDEIVIEAPIGHGSAAEVDAIMAAGEPWSTGLPLKAESYETDFYKKED